MQEQNASAQTAGFQVRCESGGHGIGDGLADFLIDHSHGLPVSTCQVGHHYAEFCRVGLQFPDKYEKRLGKRQMAIGGAMVNRQTVTVRLWAQVKESDSGIPLLGQRQGLGPGIVSGREPHSGSAAVMRSRNGDAAGRHVIGQLRHPCASLGRCRQTQAQERYCQKPSHDRSSTAGNCLFHGPEYAALHYFKRFRAVDEILCRVTQ